jgi:hypothetical protein
MDLHLNNSIKSSFIGRNEPDYFHQQRNKFPVNIKTTTIIFTIIATVILGQNKLLLSLLPSSASSDIALSLLLLRIFTN